MSDPRFHRFQSTIDGIELPDQFTFPFYYTPHALSVLASEQLQEHLNTQRAWQHNFGLNGDDPTQAIGKMFGVLVAKNDQGELGYLTAFSGKLADANLLPGFVPPVFDMLADDTFFHRDMAAINEINAQVTTLTQDPKLGQLKQQLAEVQSLYKQAEQSQREVMIANRAARKQARLEAEAKLQGDDLKHVIDELGKASVLDKNTLKYLKLEWDAKVDQIQTELAGHLAKIDRLKKARKQRSNAFQHTLFSHYQFLNADGEIKALNQIFAETTNPVPPAAAGECAAPKLLQYAYQHHYTPIAMAEFWWGQSPKSEIRKHKQFYPSCNAKCQPILGHMLKGLDVEPNPLEENWAAEIPLEIVYQDEEMVVVNKPSGMLSVPGKTIKDSAYQRLIEQFPDVEGPFVIHRLDMATSGLLVFALTKRANKSLQKQFIAREVSKRYIAKVDGEVLEKEGTITLPMRGDPDDRPRQLVCFEHGKPAETYWQLIDTIDGKSKLYMHPKTGRTHQLRVHCAHEKGLNLPMVGDVLYGTKADRLHLHAERLELAHPYTKQPMIFHAKCEF